jgi:Rap1a immunity proteins
MNMKINSWLFTGLVLVFCLPINSLGFQEKPDDVAFTAHFHYPNSESFVQQCKAVENIDLETKRVPLKDASDVGLCMGFISGVIDLDTMDSGILKHPTHEWCVPDNATTTQLAKVIVKYGNDHPEDLHLPGVLVVAKALVAAFPCGK